MIVIGAAPSGAHAQMWDCPTKKGQYLDHQLRAGKTCRESTYLKGWTDCSFRAGATEVLLVGAIGTAPFERMSGFLGSGFYFVSVAPDVRVRTMVDPDRGLLVRIDSNRCITDTAYITLRSEVLTNADFAPPLPQPSATDTPEEKRTRIKQAQEALARMGYQPGPPNGALTQETREALAKYKADNSMASSVSDEDVVTDLIMNDGIRQLDEYLEILKRLEPEVAPGH